MSDHLMSADDLESATGKKRYSKQAEWFKREFGVDVARRDDGSIVIAWGTFRALSDRKAGIFTQSTAPVREKPPVYLTR